MTNTPKWQMATYRTQGVSLLSRNHLLIIAIEEAGWLFVNDRLVAKLDLGHNQTSGWN